MLAALLSFLSKTDRKRYLTLLVSALLSLTLLLPNFLYGEEFATKESEEISQYEQKEETIDAKVLKKTPHALQFPLTDEDNITEEECCDKFEQLHLAIKEIDSHKAELEQELKKNLHPNDAEEIERRIQQLSNQKAELNRLFERDSLGVEPSRLSLTPTEEEAPYDWKHELLTIVQPVFTEMQRMTQTQRVRENLRQRHEEIIELLKTIDKSKEHLQTLTDRGELSEPVRKRLELLDERLENNRKDAEREYQIIEENLLALEDTRSFFERLWVSILEFIKGRGFILVTAFGTFFTILYLSSRLLSYLSDRRERLGYTRRVNVKWRFMVLFYRLFTFIIALISLLVVLHSMGDMVLFGLAILILLALLLSFRNYLPTYISELRTFLNLGQARQGERVIYNGLPWKIDKINLYFAYLVNPELNNGRIRLTVTMLGTLVSRPVLLDEIWFPCKVGDSLILPDGTYVEVLRQTPESIYLESFNAHIIYPTNEFLAAKPRNISKGFYAVIDFGLAYTHFNLPVDEVFAKIHAGVESHLEAEDSGVAGQINSISVEFRRIEEGRSLLYTVILDMKGTAASYYFQVQRMAQEACLRTAQKEGWTMPFTQVSIHRGKNDDFEYPDSVKFLEKTE